MTTDAQQPQGPSTSEVCEAVLKEWKLTHGIEADFSEELSRVLMRAGTWISPASVIAGVNDLFGVVNPSRPPLSRVAVSDLGNKLGMRLRDSGLLFAHPKRSGMLSG